MAILSYSGCHIYGNEQSKKSWHQGLQSLFFYFVPRCPLPLSFPIFFLLSIWNSTQRYNTIHHGAYHFFFYLPSKLTCHSFSSPSPLLSLLLLLLDFQIFSLEHIKLSATSPGMVGAISRDWYISVDLSGGASTWRRDAL